MGFKLDRVHVWSCEVTDESGAVAAKLAHLAQADANLEYIFTAGGGRFDAGRSYEELLGAGTIQVEPLTYIRGRTLPNQFLIVDEAQNLTPHEVKTIITRCGADTKIVLTGDPDQIDNPYVDSASNGLTMVAERFKTEAIAGHVILYKGERSELAERATELL